MFESTKQALSNKGENALLAQVQLISYTIRELHNKQKKTMETKLETAFQRKPKAINANGFRRKR